MPPLVSEWLNLVLRWVHVFAAILWVGSTYSLAKLALLMSSDGGEATPPWIVQGGEVYVAGRHGAQKLVAGKRLGLFPEALATWISGFLLLGLLYYSDGLLLPPESRLSMLAGVLIGIAVLFVGWAVYDLLWISLFRRAPVIGGIVCYLLLVALSFELTQIFTGRAAYIHIGALFGTILTANLLMRILPAQRKIVAALVHGHPPEPALLARVRTRSRHNLFLVIPVVFLMISNHFPLSTYGQSSNWLILSLLVLAGGIAAKFLFRL